MCTVLVSIDDFMASNKSYIIFPFHIMQVPGGLVVFPFPAVSDDIFLNIGYWYLNNYNR